jgi:hypothetical protein
MSPGFLQIRSLSLLINPSAGKWPERICHFRLLEAPDLTNAYPQQEAGKQPQCTS